MPDVLVPTPRGEMPAWLAVPPNPGSAPGVVVIHDIFGMSQDHRDQATWLAEAGFLALAVDLYYRDSRLLCVRSVIRDLTARSGPAFDDIEAARSWLGAQPNCAGKIGVIGFCMGGGFALLLISGHGFSAASVNYGGKLPPDFDNFLQAACPVVGSYGGLAKWEKGVADQLEQALDRAMVPNDVKEYPDAGHAFMNQHGTFLLKVLRYKAIGYNEAATQDARRRIISFFHTHLEG
ncbi:MAG: dienelactone hydrolase family protein [Terracidiphilus sp.]